MGREHSDVEDLPPPPVQCRRGSLPLNVRSSYCSRFARDCSALYLQVAAHVQCQNLIDGFRSASSRRWMASEIHRTMGTHTLSEAAREDQALHWSETRQDCVKASIAVSRWSISFSDLGAGSSVLGNDGICRLALYSGISRSDRLRVCLAYREACGLDSAIGEVSPPLLLVQLVVRCPLSIVHFLCVCLLLLISTGTVAVRGKNNLRQCFSGSQEHIPYSAFALCLGRKRRYAGPRSIGHKKQAPVEPAITSPPCHAPLPVVSFRSVPCCHAGIGP